MSTFTKMNQIMELKQWYTELLMEASHHPQIERNENYQEIKSTIKEALEGDGEFDYVETRKDIEYMSSFLNNT